jgi:hypothetical protein
MRTIVTASNVITLPDDPPCQCDMCTHDPASSTDTPEERE